MKEVLHVVKIGGNVITQDELLKPFINGFRKLTGPKILVHGGGKRATEMAHNLGIETQMVDGRRITDDAMIEIVTMVYGGLVNKTLVARLQASKVNAIGLSGADGNLLEATKRVHPTVDFGWVGDFTPDQVNKSLLHLLLKNSYLPVICSLTHNKNGKMLNTNADTIARNIALSLCDEYSVRLHYCFDQIGVMRDLADDQSLIEEISQSQFLKMKTSGTIFAGMIPKLENAFEAMSDGVEAVELKRADLLGSNTGTKLIL